MSEKEPTGPYVYQPYGGQDRAYWSCGRIYGVGGVSMLAVIKGLTKEEAEKVKDALSQQAITGHIDLGPSSRVCRCNCPNCCEHKWDGPEEKMDNGSTSTCSRCGMTAMAHDTWVLP